MDNRTPAGSNAAFREVEVADVYSCYAAFCALAASMGKTDLAHQLVLCEPLSIAGEAPVIAAGIASAATLCIEPSTTAVRHSIRSGAIDFTVNTLDEALRALKNEVRKGLSIAVCLADDPSQILFQMVERGVQPEILCGVSDNDARLKPFLERGARWMDTRPAVETTEMLPTRWRVQQLPGKWLPMVDDVVAACLPKEDRVRRNWLARAPRYLNRLLRTERYLPMTQHETKQCAEMFREDTQDPRWSGVEVQFNSAHWAAEFRGK